MLTPPELGYRQEGSLLGRTSPLVKLGLALAWLIGLATTIRPGPPTLLAATALAAGLVLGRIPPRRLARALAPLVIAAVSIALANLIFSGSNTNPSATELARLGPFRITQQAANAALGLGARVMAIVAVGVAFAQTTDPTRLVDALVQQARLSARFAYGALAEVDDEGQHLTLRAALLAPDGSRRTRPCRAWARISRPCARRAGSAGSAAAGIHASSSDCSCGRSGTPTSSPWRWMPGPSTAARARRLLVSLLRSHDDCCRRDV